MNAIDIFGDNAAHESTIHGGNVTISYSDNSVRVAVQEITGATEDAGRRVRVFEIQEALRLDADGDEVGFVPMEKINLEGLVRLPTLGQWALIGDDDMLSVGEVAALAGVGRQYVHDEIGEFASRLPATKVGARYVIRGADAKAWIGKPGRGQRTATKPMSA